MKNFFYRVQQGDTISRLSNRFNLPVTEIISLNNLKREIEEGDLLFIQTYDCVLYTVKPQDTVYSIAKKFNVSPQKILDDNHLPYVWWGLKIKV